MKKSLRTTNRRVNNAIVNVSPVNSPQERIVMNVPATVFEAIMIFCWGISWPAALMKTIRARSVEGVSILFLWLVFIGYVSGIFFKIFTARSEGFINPVIILYIFNFVMVGAELILYYRFRRIS
jgi:hypothetical protein